MNRDPAHLEHKNQMGDLLKAHLRQQARRRIIGNIILTFGAAVVMLAVGYIISQAPAKLAYDVLSARDFIGW